jgi:hypothetical protein
MSDCRTDDWARSCCSSQFLLAWGIPALAMVLSSSLGYGITWIWPTSLAWLGIACFLNARRCGRTHCFITGPFFIALAVVAALYSVGVVDLGSSGWQHIGNTALIGGLILCFLPEMIFGRYRHREG